METSNFVCFKFSNTQKIYDDFNNSNNGFHKYHSFETTNRRNGLGLKPKTVFLNEGIRRTKKLFSVDGTKHSAKTHNIEKRNARERCRVQAVNDAFSRLRRLIPSISARRKRVSKVKTLRKAVQYIIELQAVLQQTRA
ncbi:Helix-loop-helix protein 6 [Pseudolycoriella hygida]|uniref:Helix-loop-helix protein 6 n=1 Tax=Pseudolycoriella hygida TaxID=35572 RepID=A0A9Q0NEQ4_9DIPT|nr:Helix-loop-helix protein 6 [Pseudolycoriella hygida]